MNKKTCIVIVGPTAVGKTQVALQIAQEFNTQIISADSRQCFRELNIGVARPSSLQLQLVKHYFINSHSIHDEVNAAVFEEYALDAVHEIFQWQDLAVVVGGTGLYIKAFCEGMDEIRFVLPEVRNEIRAGYEKFGLAWLQNQVEINDPAYFTNGEILNPQRLMRTLEVRLSTGRSIRSFQTRQKKSRDFNIIMIGLQLPREELYRNINHRVDEMIEKGLVAEVSGLLPFKNRNALNTVGYRELFSYFEERTSLKEAIDNIKKNTRHYSRRQMTWFRKDQSIHWFSPDDLPEITAYCRF